MKPGCATWARSWRASKVAVPGFKGIEFQRRIRENGEKILEVYRATNDAQAKGDAITPAAQWLLDNHYLIGETVFQVKRDLPRRFYRELPVDSFGGQQMPRALAIAWAYVAHSDSSVSAAMFEAIVEGYQSVEPLKIGELWALPSLLRFVLIENLRRLAIRVDRAREMRRIANTLADRVLGGGRRRRPRQHPRRVCRICPRHDLRHATALPAARRLAQRRTRAGLAGERARAPRHQLGGGRSSPSTRRCRPATSPPPTSCAD